MLNLLANISGVCLDNRALFLIGLVTAILILSKKSEGRRCDRD